MLIIFTAVYLLFQIVVKQSLTSTKQLTNNPPSYTKVSRLKLYSHGPSAKKTGKQMRLCENLGSRPGQLFLLLTAKQVSEIGLLPAVLGVWLEQSGPSLARLKLFSNL